MSTNRIKGEIVSRFLQRKQTNVLGVNCFILNLREDYSQILAGICGWLICTYMEIYIIYLNQYIILALAPWSM